jgi:hypothetical protein
MWISLGLLASRSLNATSSQSELLLVKGQKESARDCGFLTMVETLVVWLFFLPLNILDAEWNEEVPSKTTSLSNSSQDIEGGMQSPLEWRDELFVGSKRAFLVENHDVIFVQRGRSDGTQAHNCVHVSVITGRDCGLRLTRPT